MISIYIYIHTHACFSNMQATRCIVKGLQAKLVNTSLLLSRGIQHWNSFKTHQRNGPLQVLTVRCIWLAPCWTLPTTGPGATILTLRWPDDSQREIGAIRTNQFARIDSQKKNHNIWAILANCLKPAIRNFFCAPKRASRKGGSVWELWGDSREAANQFVRIGPSKSWPHHSKFAPGTQKAVSKDFCNLASQSSSDHKQCILLQMIWSCTSEAMLLTTVSAICLGKNAMQMRCMPVARLENEVGTKDHFWVTNFLLKCSRPLFFVGVKIVTPQNSCQMSRKISLQLEREELGP